MRIEPQGLEDQGGGAGDVALAVEREGAAGIGAAAAAPVVGQCSLSLAA